MGVTVDEWAVETGGTGDADWSLVAPAMEGSLSPFPCTLMSGTGLRGEPKVAAARGSAVGLARRELAGPARGEPAAGVTRGDALAERSRWAAGKGDWWGISSSTKGQSSESVTSGLHPGISRPRDESLFTSLDHN